MGIDLIAGGRRVGHNVRTVPTSQNVYLKLLVKLYKFLARRTGSKFAETIAKRLCQSRLHKAPISLSRINRFAKGKEGKTVVVVGPVTNDSRLLDVPTLSVCALRFTEDAR